MSTLLPPNSTAQERALEASVERMATLPVHIDRTWDPTRCPAKLLPWLAWALSVDEWNAEWPEETKRDAIAASPEVHRKKGTAGALKRALRALRVHARVMWSGGKKSADPFTFRLVIDAAPTGYSAADDSELARVVFPNQKPALPLQGRGDIRAGNRVCIYRRDDKTCRVHENYPMTTTYKTVLTAAGRAAFAAAGRDVPLQLKYIYVGDGSGTAYTPTGRETSLKRRVWRGAVHRAVSVPGHRRISFWWRASCPRMREAGRSAR